MRGRPAGRVGLDANESFVIPPRREADRRDAVVSSDAVHKTTEKWGERPTLAVSTLKAEVVEGPDAGRSTWTSE